MALMIYTFEVQSHSLSAPTQAPLPDLSNSIQL